MVYIAPSLLSADFSKLQEEVKDIEQGGAEWLHLDVMDGHFVPNITFGPGLIKALRPHSNLFFDVHLMIENPDKYINEFADAGADMIVVHAEACTHLHRTIQSIHALGKKAGVALNPATSLSTLDYILPELDMVLLTGGHSQWYFVKDLLAKHGIGKDKIFGFAESCIIRGYYF